MTGEMRALLELAGAGDREAEARLIEGNSGLIWSIARRYYGRGVEPDDLYQLACVGFIKAVRGFDAARGNEFSTYAVPKIAGEIRRFLRDDGAVKVSRIVKERAVRVRRIQSDWESRHGRSPTVSELAEAAGLTAEEVAACEQADVSVDSFERELSGGGRLGDLVGDEGMEERTCLHLSLHIFSAKRERRRGPSVFCHHAVARDALRIRVCVQRIAHHTRPARVAGQRRNLSITRHAPARNFPHDCIYTVKAVCHA